MKMSVSEVEGRTGEDGYEECLWNAYMSSLVKALLLYPFSDVNVKQVDDRFNGGTDSGCGLYREKVVAVLSISPLSKIYGIISCMWIGR